MNSRISQCYTIESINKAYEQGLNNGRYEVEQEIEIIKHNAYQDGRAQAYSELNEKLVITKQLQEEAWDEGYNSAIEDYLAQGDDFVGNISCYEFGAVEDCEHSPNKEAQEAMQEVLYEGNEDSVWVANDGSGRLKVLDIVDNVCSVEVLELAQDGGFYCVGETLTISFDDLKTLWTKDKPKRKKHSHYFKDVRHLDYVDVYQVNKLFPVKDDTDCILHARKKLLVCGGRGGGKDMLKDVTEAYDTLKRYLEIEGHLDD